MLLFDVTTQFNKQIKELIKNPEQQKYLLEHERRTLVIDNICNQVLYYEKKYTSKLDLKQRDIVINEAVKMFAHAALEHHKQQQMSQLKRTILENEQNEIQETKKYIESVTESNTKVIDG